MSKIIGEAKKVLLKYCERHKTNAGYDYWNDHIRRVVEHAAVLAKEYGADAEIVKLGALLHDISMPAEYGPRSEHHVYSAKMAESILYGLHYPGEKVEQVRKCVLHHSGRNRHLRESLEEICVADADALAHFDRIPSLFSLAYNLHGMGLEEGREYVKQRLQNDFSELSERTKEKAERRYRAIMEIVFVD